jgi:acyl-CoA thioesterase-1
MAPLLNRSEISPRAGWFLGLFGLLLLCATSAALAAGICPASPIAPLNLPHLRTALLHGEEVVIVALGSSSTLGVMASDPAHSYPAVLQRALSTELADGHIAVINRGIGGQDAREELARLDADVLALRPQVVIWQVGANGALRHSDPEQFRERVTEGVRKIRAAGADVILMDNQQSPRLLARADEPVFDQILAQVASETGASLFSRRALMKAWEQDGDPPAEFVAADGLHHNDRGYYCVATTLAREIIRGLAADRPQTASR